MLVSVDITGHFVRKHFYACFFELARYELKRDIKKKKKSSFLFWRHMGSQERDKKQHKKTKS